MRVTQGMMSTSLLANLNDITERLAATQRSISSGQSITKPSDDPLGTQRALGLQGAIEGAQQQGRNVDAAIGWLQTSDDALSGIGDIINRAHELTVQGASDSLGPDQRNAIALEMDQLVQAIKDNANATYQGSYVFSGTKTTTPPYANGSNAYNGDGNAIARTIGPGVSVTVNTDISQILGNGTDSKLIATLQGISAHLRSGDSSQYDLLRTTDLQQLSDNQDVLNQSRATLGSTMSRLESAKSRLSDVELTTTKLLSNTEDTDLSKAILDLTNQQNVYQAALRSGASIIQPSLLDFLR